LHTCWLADDCVALVTDWLPGNEATCKIQYILKWFIKQKKANVVPNIQYARPTERQLCLILYASARPQLKLQIHGHGADASRGVFSIQLSSVPNYTAWWQRQMTVRNLPSVLHGELVPQERDIWAISRRLGVRSWRIKLGQVGPQYVSGSNGHTLCFVCMFSVVLEVFYSSVSLFYCVTCVCRISIKIT